MALRFSLKISEEEIYPEAYAHIDHASSNSLVTMFSVNCYKTHQERIDAGGYYPFDDRHLCPVPIKTFNYELKINQISNAPLWESMYSYLKTLPEFFGAIDIFEPAAEESAPVEEVILQEDLQSTQPPAEA